MANSYEATHVYRGLDRELVKVGRPVRGNKALAVVDDIHHCWAYRRKHGLKLSYMFGHGEITTPTRGVGANDAYYFTHTTGPHTQWVRVNVIVQGASGTSGAPALTLAVSGGAAQDFAISPRAGGDNPLQRFAILAAVTPDTTETFVIDQSAGATPVRVVSIGLDEVPDRFVRTADSGITPSGIVAPSEFAGGTDIIDSEHDDPFVAAQQLRRYHVPVVFSCGKHFSTTSAAYTAIALGSTGLAWTLYLAPVLSERTGTSVTCRVFGTDSTGAGAGANGHVRFTWADASTTIVDVNAASQWYSNTATIGKNSDSAIIQLRSEGGTINVYAIVIEQTAEAA